MLVQEYLDMNDMHAGDMSTAAQDFIQDVRDRPLNSLSDKQLNWLENMKMHKGRISRMESTQHESNSTLTSILLVAACALLVLNLITLFI